MIGKAIARLPRVADRIRPAVQTIAVTDMRYACRRLKDDENLSTKIGTVEADARFDYSALVPNFKDRCISISGTRSPLLSRVSQKSREG
jgi:hypothetical protein